MVTKVGMGGWTPPIIYFSNNLRMFVLAIKQGHGMGSVFPRPSDTSYQQPKHTRSRWHPYDRLKPDEPPPRDDIDTPRRMSQAEVPSLAHDPHSTRRNMSQAGMPKLRPDKPPIFLRYNQSPYRRYKSTRYPINPDFQYNEIDAPRRMSPDPGEPMRYPHSHLRHFDNHFRSGPPLPDYGVYVPHEMSRPRVRGPLSGTAEYPPVNRFQSAPPPV